MLALRTQIRGRVRRAGLIAALAGAALLTGPVSQALAADGQISGTVTDAATHAPLSGAEVDVYDSGGDWLASSVTDGSGDYAITVAPGTYKVGFNDYADDTHVGQFFNDRPTVDAADPVVVSSGSATSGVSAALAAAGLITGKVTDAVTHTPVAGVQVIAYDSGGDYVAGAQTDSAGRYTIGGLATGTYRVQFAPSYHQPYASQYYSGTGTLGTADAVGVTGGHATGLIDAQLAAAARITGVVTDASTHQPVARAEVDVLDADGTDVGSAETDASGSYTIGGLAPGSYKVEFSSGDSGGNYAPQTGGPVSATAGQSATANAALTAGGQIEGTVTDAQSGTSLDGVEVTAYDAAGDALGFAATGSDGTYRLGSLGTGSYTVGFVDFDSVHAPLFYNGRSTEASADPVPVTVGQPTQGINAALPTGGAITGEVTDATAGRPVAGVAVTAYDAAGDDVANARTDASGKYTIGGLAAGSYRVGFAPEDGTPAYSTQFYDGARSLAAATAVPVALGQTASAIDAAMAGGGSVEGTVTAAGGGQPLSGIQVALYTSNGQWVSSATTDSSGRYFAGGLPAGSYLASFTDESGGYLQQYYSGAASEETADQFPIVAGQTTDGVGAAMQSAATIAGTVTDAATHQPVAGVSVQAYGSGGFWYGDAVTAADGSYSIDALAPGSYTVSFTGGGSSNYLTQYYNGGSSATTADQVTVSSGQTATGINAALGAGGAISGTVTDGQSGTGIGGTFVTVYDSSGDYVTSATAAGDGSYTVGGLPTGSYRVGFSAADGSAYVSTFYDGESTLASADPVAVTVGRTTTQINGALPRTGAISGAVTDAALGAPLPGVQVQVYDAQDDIVGFATTDADGAYLVSGLPAGSYRVGFSTGGYGAQYYNGSGTLAGAGAVSVTAGQTTDSIDAAMPRAGVVEGTVTGGPEATPLAGVTVQVLLGGGFPVATTTTLSDGTYAFGGLSAGRYTIGFFPSQGMNYLPEYYDGQTNQDSATPVTVANGTVDSGIDAQLAVGGEITGRVTSAAGGAPVQGVMVSASGDDTGSFQTATTDANGDYTIAGLASDTYTVSFATSDGSYVDGTYADSVPVTAGQTTGGIDIALAPAARIEGTVTDAATHAPAQGIEVTVYDSSGDYAGSTFTDATGAYTVTGLAAGDYEVGFSPSTQDYLAQYYDGKSSLGSADPVSLAGGQTATGIDAAMQPGGQISGTVTDAGTHNAVPNVWVTAYDSGGDYAGSTYTDSSGGYTISGLATGSYRVEFSGPGSYVAQFYDGKATLTSADPVSVTTAANTGSIDAAIQNGGSIAGTVTDASSGQPLSGVTVSVFGSSGYFTTTTGPDGSYSIGGLVSGSYSVEFIDGGYVSEYYKDRTTTQAPDPVRITAGQATTGIDAALQHGGTITGTVTDASTGQPVAGLPVYAYVSGEFETTSATTDANGHYQLTGLATGSYEVGFGAYGSGGPDYVPQYWDGEGTLSGADPVSVTTGQTTPRIDASMHSGAQIEGTVTDASAHAAIQGIEVTAYDSGGNYVEETSTASDGSYALSGLPAGSYRVGFSSFYTQLNYLPRYWNGETALSSADPITLAAGQTATGIDGSLQTGGQISGTVTDGSTHAAIANVYVQALDSNGNLAGFAYTRTDGTYTISALAAGSYRVGFTSAGRYATQYYDGKTSLTAADAVSVSTGQTATGIDAALSSGGSITGTVTDASSGLPASGITVSVYSSASSSSLLTSTATDGSGKYAVAGLGTGSYRVEFSGGGYVTQYYDGRSSLTGADAVSVTYGAATSGIDAAMQLGGAVAGTVTDASTHGDVTGIFVTAYDSHGAADGFTTTNSNGAYQISGLAPGSYTVGFSTGGGQNYLPQYYNGASSFAAADPVTVTAGQTTTGIDAALEPGAEIEGTVTDSSTGQPLSGITVYATTSGGQVVYGTRTDSQGHYAAIGLQAGTYNVEFLATGQQNYLPLNDDGVTVASGQTLTGIDGAMQPGSQLTGTVTSAATGNPLSGIDVQAIDSGGTTVASAQTDANGDYSLIRLDTGSYRVSFSDPAGFHFSQYYTGRSDAGSADPVAVTAGQTSSGIGAALQPAGRISGTVLDAETGGPIAGADVILFDSVDTFVEETESDSGGGYSFGTLTPGTYYVRFLTGDSAGNYGPQYYNGRSTLATADPVTVTSEATASGIDGHITNLPVDISPPTISGKAQQGQTVSAQHGSWTHTPTSYDYQWLRCNGSGSACAAIAGATDSTYVATADEVAGTLEVVETAVNAGGAGQPATSAPTAVVLPAPPVNGSPPTVSGKPQQGQTLTEAHGLWTNNPTSYAYHWLRCDDSASTCAPISGATGQTYVAGADDVGSMLEVQEIATNAGGSSSPATSWATAVVVPPVPVNTEPPSISSTAKQGETLTEEPGSWTGSPTSFEYQWLRCDSGGSSCAPISGATEQTYMLTGDDVGARIEVAETAVNDGGASQPATSAPTAVVVAATPVSTSEPTITGTAQEGDTLTEQHGGWTNDPTSYTYHWLRCDSGESSCAPISGATNQTYALTDDDVGSTVEVAETATNAAGPSQPATSQATAVVLPAAPVSTSPPAVTGTAAQGDTMTVVAGGWSGSPTSISDQWLRCDSSGSSCAPISGASGQTYVLTSDDVGSTIEVAETASNTGGHSLPATSAPTAVVVAEPPVDMTLPAISGTAQEGQTLTEKHGAWTNQPTSYSYQWLQCDSTASSCTAISGATDQTYAVTAADVGGTIEAQETATNADGPSIAATSIATATVLPAAPVSTSPPAVTGTAAQGDTMTVVAGGWSGSPTSISDQWLRCDSSGSSCAPISGASGPRYVLTGEDVGSTIEVAETATNTGGTGNPAGSAPTAVVTPSLPVDQSPPAITGTARQGETLTEQDGAWSNQPTGYGYQWLRCNGSGSGCAPISGATGQKYVPTSDDVGSTLEVAETATNGAGTSQPAISAPTATVTIAPPTATSAPTITGTPEAGKTLTEQHGSWTGSPTAYTYQWQRCDANGANCQPIPGAAGQGYTLTIDDIGSTIVVEETASNPGGASKPDFSTATAPVTAAPLHADAGEPIAAPAGAETTLDGSASTPSGLITGYHWDFGDGSSGDGETAKHTYGQAGHYTATLTVSEGSSTAQSTVAVTVAAATAKGPAVTVEDSGGAPIQGADVVYIAPDGTRTSATTGSDGVATLPGLPDGTDSVYAWADGYQVGVGQVDVSGGTGSAIVKLVSGSPATASLSSHPMTLSEIEAAGIDPNDPANQNVWSFDVQLAFPSGYGAGNPPSLCGYLNDAGQFVGATGICGSGGGGGGGGWGCRQDTCYGPGVEAVGAVVDGHPLIEWLTLSGQVSVLKQFFSVDMLIQNLSPEPVELSNGSATLNIPDGLSLAPTSQPQSATQSVPTIPGMGSADVNWVVRGDTPGYYYLSADYQATLEPFSAPFALHATLQTPLHVWGPEALSMSVQADSGTLQPGRPYHVRLAVTNKADVPFYNVGLTVDSSNHKRFIFQPDERLSDTIGELDPGQTLYSHTYILVPDAASAGAFDPSLSTIDFAGQTGPPGAGATAVTPPKLYTLSALGDTPGKVHLHWQSVPNATGYEVFSTPDLDTPFATGPDIVQDAHGSSVTLLPGSATDAYIPGSQLSTKYYAVSAIVNAVPTLEYTVISAAAGSASGGGGSGAPALTVTPDGATFREGYLAEIVAQTPVSTTGRVLTARFHLTSGPNAKAMPATYQTAVHKQDGEASFSYVGRGSPGVDHILVTTTDVKGQTHSVSTTVTWSASFCPAVTAIAATGSGQFPNGAQVRALPPIPEHGTLITSHPNGLQWTFADLSPELEYLYRNLVVDNGLGGDGLSLEPEVLNYVPDGVGVIFNKKVLKQLPIPMTPGQIKTVVLSGVTDNLSAYLDNEILGVDALKKTFVNWRTACPHTKIVLSGYSQGAMVVRDFLRYLAAKSSAADQQAIGGAVLLADPERISGSKVKNLEGAPALDQGLCQFTYQLSEKLGLPPCTGSPPDDVPGYFRPQTVQVCTLYDPVCDTSAMIGEMVDDAYGAFLSDGGLPSVSAAAAAADAAYYDALQSFQIHTTTYQTDPATALAAQFVLSRLSSG